MAALKEIITLTLGDCAENHVGNQQIGQKLPAGSGFTRADLERIRDAVVEKGGRAELVTLTTDRMEVPDASVLILRDGVCFWMGQGSQQAMYEEQIGLEWDQKVKMYGRVVQKHARHNLCYDEKAQEPDYEQGKGRIIALETLPYLTQFMGHIKEWVGPKAEGLKVEGNRYYDVTKTGIGFHGDTERVKVIAVRLGSPEGTPIVYQWFYKGEPVGEPIVIPLHAGDVYLMSEKAVGQDWKRSVIPTLRHATGCAKFTGIKDKPDDKKKVQPAEAQKKEQEHEPGAVMMEKQWSLAELKEECKRRGLKGYSSKNKAELMALLGYGGH